MSTPIQFRDYFTASSYTYDQTVTFTNSLPDANYEVGIETDADIGNWIITSKTGSGFSISWWLPPTGILTVWYHVFWDNR